MANWRAGRAGTAALAGRALLAVAMAALLAREAGAQVFYGSPASPISSGVVIPPGMAQIWISGTVPPVLKADAPAGSRDRYGDTRTQAAGILKIIGTQLEARA